jgi:hypothetical protein
MYPPGLILCVCEQGFGNEALLLAIHEVALLFGVAMADCLHGWFETNENVTECRFPNTMSDVEVSVEKQSFQVII